MNYQNYHKHCYYSNVITPDSTVSPKDYAERAVELGQELLSSVNHGWQGRYIEYYELAKEFNLKYLFGVETYFVPNRLEKDNSNAHLILLAKNENGRKHINRILSEANLTGFYYRPRIDLDLLFSLPPKDVWVTTACIAGVFKYENGTELALQMHEHFKENFFLEVQNHNVEAQQKLNLQLINLANQYKIKTVFGCDSHYIDPKQSKLRDDYLLSKHIEYSDENHWYMDYPSYEEAFQRFEWQKALTKAQIAEAMDNTNIFLEVEPYTSEVFQKGYKIPTLYVGKSQADKNQILCDLVWRKWADEKPNIPPKEWEHYESEIQKELTTIIDTGMADYFMLDYEIVKLGVEMGGKITFTGRGSSPSFIISKLIGLTTIDRISAPVKLFPERFITKERILESKTLPDVDLNLGNPEVFAKAQADILGIDHSYPMLAFGTLKPKAAWKLYARAKEVEFEVANKISEQIDAYESALKYAEESEREFINLVDFVDHKYLNLILESEQYLGIVSDFKIHPCAYLLYQKNISEEIGLVKIKDHLCACIDGLWAEKYGFLKNDLLKVSVVDMIYRIYQRIGIKPHTLPELIKLCENDPKVWEIYKNAWVVGVNQVEQTSTSGRVAKYAPQNISELAAFVAAVRPGFKSNYKQFEAREAFDYGVPSLDAIIQTKEFPYSYMLYQENVMQVMAYAGIPISESYDVLKNIAKKRAEKVFAYKEKFLAGMTQKIMEHEGLYDIVAQEVAQRIWKIIEDSSSYSFNSCVSGSTRIQKAGTVNRFYPSVEEMYLIMNDKEYAKKTNHIHLYDKYKRYGYGNALSMGEDGRIRKNKIVDIRPAGIQKTYLVKTSRGSSIVCTMNHKFPTPNGEKYLSELGIGDLLYIKDVYEKEPWNKKRRLTNEFDSNAPKKGQMGFQKKPNGASVVYDKFRCEKREAKAPCEICNCVFDGAKRFEVHHKDGDRKNNDPSNYQWCCVSCHKKADYKLGRRKVFEKGIPTIMDEIVSVEFSKEEVVYDVEMESPNHNFVTESGLVTSNSHAFAYAGDSLYGAYLKSHYPFEFYETFLQIMENDGDKDRLVKAKKEAAEAFGIKFPPYRWGQDNRTIRAFPEKNEITSSLSSIKGFGNQTAEDLYALSKNHYDTFVDFLIDAEETGKISKKYESLILIRYFDIFGGNRKLLTFFREFIGGELRYSRKHSDKTKEKRKEALFKMWNGLPDEDVDLMEQIQNEQELLGYITVVHPNLSKKYVYVMEVDVRFAPRMQCYCLATGAQASLKVQKNRFEVKPILAGDVLYIDNFEKRPAVEYQNGEFVEKDNEFTWWVSRYRIIPADQMDALLKR